MPEEKPKIISIVGPTASGKSDLAVEIAKEFKGEVISADSRQVYTGLDIGSGKITKKEMMGIPHHLLDVINPKKTFTVSNFKKLADEKIKEIVARGKTPILCGGTGFYIDAVTKNILLPDVPPNEILRKKLASKKLEVLQKMLSKLDPLRFRTIDQHNPVRLIRAIEIAKVLGKVPKAIEAPQYKTLYIGIKPDDATLKEKIRIRLLKRIKQGMIKEVEELHKNGLSWKRMEALGLEYRYVALYLQNKISKDEMIRKLETEICQYAKRQMIWFKKNKEIHWIEKGDKKGVEKLIKEFLNE
jgi:tRNA dimethylallyltransferase